MLPLEHSLQFSVECRKLTLSCMWKMKGISTKRMRKEEEPRLSSKEKAKLRMYGNESLRSLLDLPYLNLPSYTIPPEQASDFTVHDLCKVRSDIPGYLEKLVSYLATAVQTGDFLFVCTFLGIFQRFGTTWQVLDLIMERYASFQPDSEEDQQTKDAICFFLGLWMEKLPGDFCQSPDQATLNKLRNYVQVNMPSSALAVQIQELLPLLEVQESKKATPKKEEASGASTDSASLSVLRFGALQDSSF
ncbi:ral guanine nucleotide dissociation stimulator-like [Nannospalax galili]|uniref:ral guanine nucleotide dissociation stimulator-like n=1 Tax=Nannospalax galili TaxID=1026970 RepID=UPI00111C2516|nr:ral guanine nucleotide dissociation stimulator-like [Nannospalax galili]